MKKLKSEEFSHLSENAIKLLHKNRITTVLEFLQEDIIKLSTITKLNLPDIISTRHEIFTKYSAPLINGTTLLLNNLLTKTHIRSGIQSFDVLLKGGIPLGYITEFCGLADSGKTQLCFQIVINCAREMERIVLYIDTKGDFSAIRIQKILEAHKYSYKEMAKIMVNIKVIRIWTIEELIELFQQIKNKLISIENLELIIIDSLPCLMFQFLGNENKIGLSLLNTFVNYSRYLIKELSLAIICVNIQTRWIDQDVPDLEDDGAEQIAFKDCYIEKRNRCLGKYWQHIPMLVVNLEKYEECDSENGMFKLKVSVIRSNQSVCENSNCTLTLSALGIT